MNLPGLCPDCGGPVADDAVEGLCPRCVVRWSLRGDVSSPEAANRERRIAKGETGLLDSVAAERPPEIESGRPSGFAGYELLSEIKRGGMGVVYRARQKSLNRIVAIKMILFGRFADRRALERFRAEAESVALLNHPHIVPIHEIGELDGQPWFSMDFIDGHDLGEEIARGTYEPRTDSVGTRPGDGGFRDRVARLVIALCEAVQHAHQHGVIHRDLKPANVLIDGAGAPHLTDFGLARRLDTGSDLTVTGQTLGSPHYMPPEQAGGDHRGASTAGDVYSLGAILYHLLTGRPPFEGATLAEVLRAVVDRPPIPPRTIRPEIDPVLEVICLKCLEKEPAKRYASARDLGEDLERFLADELIRARSVGRPERVWRWCRRNPTLAVSSALVGVLASVLVVGSPLVAWHFARAREAEASARRQAQRNLYVADMGLALQGFSLGNRARARELLERHLPDSALPPGSADHRGWEWHFLNAQLADASSVTLGQGFGGVPAVALSPDGRHAAATCIDQRLRIWNWQSRTLLTNLPTTHIARAVSFSPDGHWLFVAGDGPFVRALQTGSWSERFRLEMPSPIQGLAVSPDRRLLMALASDSTVVVWNLETRREQSRRSTGSGRFSFESPIAFSGDGHWLAMPGSEPAEVRLVDRTTGAETGWFGSHERTLTTLAFSPDGKWLATAGFDSTVRVWGLPEHRLQRTLKRHAESVFDLAFSPDGRRLASASVDQRIVVWDTGTWSEHVVLTGHADEVWSVAFAPDSRTLVSGSKDGTVRIWNLELPADVLPALLPDRWLSEAGAERWWALPGSQADRLGREVRRIPGGPPVIEMWDAEPFRRRWRFELPPDCHLGLPSEDESVMALARSDGSVVVQDIPTGRTLQELSGGAGIVTALPVFRSDGTLLLVRDGGPLEAWDWREGQEMRLAGFRSSEFRAAALARDGRWLVLTYGNDAGTCRVEVWDWRARRLVTGLAHSHVISGVALTSDGRTVYTVSWDSRVRVWDTPAGRLRHVLGGEVAAYTSVVLTPDETRLLAGTARGGVRIWNVAVDPPTELGTWSADPGRWEIATLSLSPAGDRLYTGAEDGLRVWSTGVSRQARLRP